MPTYILLLTLTTEGRAKMAQDADSVLRAESAIRVFGVQPLGLYGVLGPYDFVGIIEAPDNEAAGRFSLQLGARAGVNVVTMPTLPVTRLEGRERARSPELETGARLPLPGEPAGDGPKGLRLLLDRSPSRTQLSFWY